MGTKCLKKRLPKEAGTVQRVIMNFQPGQDPVVGGTGPASVPSRQGFPAEAHGNGPPRDVLPLKKIIKKIITFGKHSFFEEGIQLYNQGLFSEALEKFKKITVYGQNETSLHFNLASSYSGIIHRTLGLFFLHKGDFPEAITHFNQALEFNPSHFEIYNYLGIAYNTGKKYKKAMSAFSRVLELAPDLLSLRYKVAVVLYNLGKYDEALEEMKHLVALNPKFADFHYHLGVVYAHQKQFEQAQKTFSRAIELNPHYLSSKIQLSLVMAAEGNYESSLEILNDIIKEKPKYPDIHYHAGLIRAAQKDWKGALDSIRRALEINENYASPHFILGLLYLRTNEYDKAVKEIQKALDLDLEESKHSFAKNILDCLERRKKTTPVKGRETLLDWMNPLEENYLETVFQTFPQHLSLVPDYIEILDKFDSKWDRPLLVTLIRLYDEAITKTPKYADLHFQLGRIYDQMDAWDKAVGAFTKALEINPCFVKARMGLYHIFMKVQMLERAKNELEILLQQGIQFPDLYLDFAEIYLAEKNCDSALSCVQEAIKINSEFEKAFLLASVIWEKKGEIAKALGILNEYKEQSGQFSNKLILRILELKKKVDGV
jgi:tetratricopeptide (TPR) repeat protein